MIQTRYPGEWTCTECDAGHNGYIATQTWWRGRAPKVCWPCIHKKWSKPKRVDSAAYAVAQAIETEQRTFGKSSEVRSFLINMKMVVEGVSSTRFSAMVFRILKGID